MPTLHAPATVPRELDRLARSVFYPFINRREVVRTAFFESKLDLKEVVVRWDAATGGWEDDAFPNIGTEPWCCYVCVLKAEDGDLKGLEIGFGLGW